MLGVPTAPPHKPRASVKTNRAPKYHYTIHSKPSDAFTLRANERTGVVAFHRWDDAFMLSHMMETYFTQEKELPRIGTSTLVLPQKKNMTDLDLNFLYIQQWDFDDLKMFCINHMFNIISVQRLKDTKVGYSIEGNVYDLKASEDFYRLRFEELLPLNTDADDGPY
jgi:hypothetical protein